MRIRFSYVMLMLLAFLLSGTSFAAAPSVIMNSDAHVGEQAVLSVETSQIPNGGSVEW